MKETDILLVEDSKTDAELILRCLKKNLLCKVFTVQDGAEALDFVFGDNLYQHRKNARDPKMIFLDLKLPKVNGLEVLRILKSDPRTQSIPIVMLTSSNQDKDLASSYKLGVNSYIVKPVDFDVFSKTIVSVANYWMYLNHLPKQHPSFYEKGSSFHETFCQSE